jgi:uncharacterized membrane protein YwzB
MSIRISIIDIVRHILYVSVLWWVSTNIYYDPSHTTKTFSPLLLVKYGLLQVIKVKRF